MRAPDLAVRLSAFAFESFWVHAYGSGIGVQLAQKYSSLPAGNGSTLLVFLARWSPPRGRGPYQSLRRASLPPIPAGNLPAPWLPRRRRRASGSGGKKWIGKDRDRQKQVKSGSLFRAPGTCLHANPQEPPESCTPPISDTDLPTCLSIRAVWACGDDVKCSATITLISRVLFADLTLIFPAFC